MLQDMALSKAPVLLATPNSLLHSQRSMRLSVCKIADTFLSYFIFLAKACSTYRRERLCSMPPSPKQTCYEFYWCFISIFNC